ncbi:MAG: hypothetical protein GY941_15930 [Planctomycetes bacterium]|nr:hypothetical protein [Planctomycetota bacterium]
MYEDPVVKEIRQIRLEIESSCQNDPEKYYEHIKEVQKVYSNRLVRFKPKPTLRATTVR